MRAIIARFVKNASAQLAFLLLFAKWALIGVLFYLLTLLLPSPTIRARVITANSAHENNSSTLSSNLCSGISFIIHPDSFFKIQYISESIAIKIIIITTAIVVNFLARFIYFLLFRYYAHLPQKSNYKIIVRHYMVL
jgi:hypothetical protein